ILPANVRAKRLPSAVMDAYRGPFPTPESRRPQQIFAGQILASRPWLAEVERRLPVLRALPALSLWPTRDIAFRNRERRRWQELFPRNQTIAPPNAGRFIPEDAAAEIITAVLNWRPNHIDNDSGRR